MNLKTKKYKNVSGKPLTVKVPTQKTEVSFDVDEIKDVPVILAEAYMARTYMELIVLAKEQAPEPKPEIDFNSFTVKELKTKCDERGLEYTSRTLKADLVEMLEGDYYGEHQ